MTRHQPATGRRRTNYNDQVEVEKMDAETFLKPRNTEADLMAHALPMGPPPVTPPPSKMQDDVAPEILPPPPPLPSNPLDRILSLPTVARLAEKFGVLGAGEALTEAKLEAGGVSVPVSFLKPHYDDFLWGLGEIESRIRAGQDLNLMRGDQSRTSFLNHLSSCYTVVKIDGQYVWDFFAMTGDIVKISPSWNRQTMSSVPYLYRGEMANMVFATLRHLHPDLLFALRSAVLDAFPKGGGADEVEETVPDETEDPSTAA